MSKIRNFLSKPYVLGSYMSVPNPPTIQPTSPLIQPIDITSAIEMYRAGRIGRNILLSIPAFRSSVMHIAGVVGQFPYQQFNANKEHVTNPFLDQPENGIGLPSNATWTRMAEDLILDASSLLLVTDTYSNGFPKAAKRIPWDRWSQDELTGVVTVDGEKVDPGKALVFVSPFDGLCEVAGPTVKMLAELRASTMKFLRHPQAREYLKNNGGARLNATQIETLLTEWDRNRQTGVTAYLPEGLELAQLTMMSPEQLTLNAANEFGISEVARLLNIDPSWLALSITTRQYSNIVDERRNFIDFVCKPYVQSIERRLSMPDFTPQGHTVKANMDTFLRGNTKERMETYLIGKQVNAYTDAEIRDLEDKPPLPPTANTGGTE